jgi:phosphatidylglycerophosphatase A
VHKLVASWFGTGWIVRVFTKNDTGAGTVGSVFALALSLWLSTFGLWAQGVSILVVLGLAYWSIRPLVAEEGDAGWIVIDEAAGTLLATIGLSLFPALVAFVVFRLADIFKGDFAGVLRAEALPGATGIIADDMLAGLYGLVAGVLVAIF